MTFFLLKPILKVNCLNSREPTICCHEILKFLDLFTLNDCLFGVVKFTKNADPDKCFYSRYSTGFD